MRTVLQDAVARGRRDRGFALVSAMLVALLLSGAIFLMTATAGRATVTATATSNFTISGQLADVAVQDATYQVNEGNLAALPTSPGTARVAATDKDGDGVKDWSWWVDAPTTVAGRMQTVIHAEGHYRGTTRRATAKAQSLIVGGFTATSGQQITYELSPYSAFGHTVLARDTTLTDGINVDTTSGQPFLSGNIGVLGTAPTITTSTGATVNNPITYMLYGANTASLPLTPATRVPAGLQLDAKFVTENADWCSGKYGTVDNGETWVASKHGGILVANGNAGCYKSMVFDVPTTISGSGAFNAFVTGTVTISASISASTDPVSPSGLNIYAGGNQVSFNLAAATESTVTVQNTFIYAPTAACTTDTGTSGVHRSSTVGFDFTGSLACASVNVAGKLTGTTPVGALGGDNDSVTAAQGGTVLDQNTYNARVWYLVDYDQPSGSRDG
ncbi:hypothetical protein V6N00_13420 [Tersicoccus sp. MR15.9]